MRVSPLDLAPFLLIALAACGGDAKPVVEVEEPSAPVPRTVDKGGGCTVEITRDGTGTPARVGDEVALTYEVRVKDAEATLASTEGWVSPLRVRLGAPEVLPGLSRGIEGLRPGTQARIEVPPEMAYGEAGIPSASVPPQATLIFDVEIKAVRP
jgi:FKBP-type peptidyl-prolyl cis-trans isomerase